MYKNLVFALLSLLLLSCSPYQKALKSSDVSLKIKNAESYYKKKDYRRAIGLFEQVYSRYLGKPQGERIIYMYGISTFQPDTNKGNYIVSSEIFKTFLEYYPTSEKASEVLFLEGKSNYMLSPDYQVDQYKTKKAIELLQKYINLYPEEKYSREASKMVVELNNKLEKKAFEIAKQYNTMEDHKASIKSLELFLLEYPGSIYSEDAYYYMLKSSFIIATNSIKKKEKKRMEDTIAIYKKLIRRFPNSNYKKEANQMHKSLIERLKENKSDKTT